MREHEWVRERETKLRQNFVWKDFIRLLPGGKHSERRGSRSAQAMKTTAMTSGSGGLSFHHSWYCFIWRQGSVSAVWYEWVNVGRMHAHCLTSNTGFVFQSFTFILCLVDRRYESHLGLSLQDLCYNDWLTSVWTAITVLCFPLPACLKLHQAHLGFQRGFALSLYIKIGGFSEILEPL